jgi:hypothetical protein
MPSTSFTGEKLLVYPSILVHSFCTAHAPYRARKDKIGLVFSRKLCYILVERIWCRRGARPFVPALSAERGDPASSSARRWVAALVGHSPRGKRMRDRVYPRLRRRRAIFQQDGSPPVTRTIRTYSIVIAYCSDECATERRQADLKMT